MRRRQFGGRGTPPPHLLRYDWRDWRPPAAEDDPAPWYSTWYLGLSDWTEARREWAAGRPGAAGPKLPRPVADASANTAPIR